jgi:peptidoglycan/xylan/chitin deacetylase (PgdA/CDA1 family)
MLPLFITIDTEYSSGLYARGLGVDMRRNFDSAIACRSAKGEAGIHYQMDVFDRHGLKAVFFVDPMPALVWGQEAVDIVVQPILKRGHDVQLHLHTEWLSFAKTNPVGSSTGQHLKHFSFDEQLTLLSYASERLVEAGAAFPTAFRAGNYGANEDSLSALSTLGIAYDSSFPPGIAKSDCDIDLSSDVHHPLHHGGLIELPIGAIQARKSAQRHAQITALSLAELRGAVSHSAAQNWPAFVIVSHSFEMFNRAKNLPNKIVMRRFEGFCAWLETQPNVRTTTFSDVARGAVDLAPSSSVDSNVALLPHNPLRTAYRIGEQLVGRVLY